MSHKFGYAVYLFSCNFRKSLISFVMSALTHFLFSKQLFSFHEFVSLLLLMIFCFNSWWSGYRVLFSFSYICLDLICVWVCGQFWRKFHEVLRRQIYMHSSGEMFCKHLKSIWLVTTELQFALTFMFCLCLNSLSWGRSGIFEVFHYRCVSQYVT